jgi:phosphatidylinositol 3-kinase
MLTNDGRFLHIDFGFCFGCDPKPYPPPFKLSPYMVDGMGGMSSEHYNKFKEYCCEAYNRIRSHANVLLSLVALMLDSQLQSITEGDKCIKKVLLLATSKERAVSQCR